MSGAFHSPSGRPRQSGRQNGRQEFDSFVVDGKINPEPPLGNEVLITGDDDDLEAPIIGVQTRSGKAPGSLSMRDLMSAVHGVEQALHEERMRNQNLRDTLTQLKAKHESDLQALQAKLAQAEERSKTLEAQSAPRAENEKALQIQVATLTEQANRMRSELERHFLEKSEEKTKLRFEMQLLQNSQQYNTQRCLQLEKALDESRRQAEQTRLDYELHRRDALQKENRLKQTIETAEAENEKFEQRITSLTQEVRSLRTMEEQATRHRLDNEELRKQLRDARAKLDDLTRAHENEKLQHRQALNELEGERKEKHSLLGILRAAELKMAEVDDTSYAPPAPQATLTPPKKDKAYAPPPPFKSFDHLSREEAEDIVSKLILPSLK